MRAWTYSNSSGAGASNQLRRRSRLASRGTSRKQICPRTPSAIARERYSSRSGRDQKPFSRITSTARAGARAATFHWSVSTAVSFASGTGSPGDYPQLEPDGFLAVYAHATELASARKVSGGFRRSVASDSRRQGGHTSILRLPNGRGRRGATAHCDPYRRIAKLRGLFVRHENANRFE